MTTKSKVYSFYAIIIGLCVMALFFFDFNVYAKAVLCFMIFLCFCIMRAAKNAMELHQDINPDTMELEPAASGAIPQEAQPQEAKTNHESMIDAYLKILIEEDKALCDDPDVDQNSPSYNNLLNDRINKRLYDKY